MTFHRRAGAPRLIEWTGERCVPWTPDVPVIYEHLHRYFWAGQIVHGRRVLDLGSGEGFGAAILAEHGAEVLGIDIDATTVEHSQLNYDRPGLTFRVASATDLSMFDAGTFGAVVAFEMIEHVQDHGRVLAEIRRVLRDDGVLVISTPDRRLYTEASGYHNPFHVRELSSEEFEMLIKTHFEHCQLFGQGVISGSQINALDAVSAISADTRTTNFLIARAGEDWRLAPTFPPRYLISVASKVPLKPTSPLSTLVDAEVTLLRAKEDELRAVRSNAERKLEEHAYELEVAGRDLTAAMKNQERLIAERERLTRELKDLRARRSVRAALRIAKALGRNG